LSIKEAIEPMVPPAARGRQIPPERAPRGLVPNLHEHDGVRCDEVMRTNVPLVPEDRSVQHVAEVMRDENLGFLPIVRDDGSRRLVGVVTDRDLVVTAVAGELELRSTPVGHVMSTPVVTAAPDEDVESALGKMAELEIRRLPIVDDEHRVLGVLSLHDLAQREDVETTGTVFREVSRPSAR
jgi:CBS domain-containing protein